VRASAGARCCRRTRTSHSGYVLRRRARSWSRTSPTNARFGSAPLLSAEGRGIESERPRARKAARSESWRTYRAPREFTIHTRTSSGGGQRSGDRDRSHARPRRRCDGARSTFARSSRTGRTSSRSWARTACSRYASPSVERVLGTPPGAARAQCFDYVTRRTFRSSPRPLAGAIHHPGVPQAAQFRFRAQDGAWRVLEAVGQARVGPGDAVS